MEYKTQTSLGVSKKIYKSTKTHTNSRIRSRWDKFHIYKHPDDESNRKKVNGRQINLLDRKV